MRSFATNFAYLRFRIRTLRASSGSGSLSRPEECVKYILDFECWVNFYLHSILDLDSFNLQRWELWGDLIIVRGALIRGGREQQHIESFLGCTSPSTSRAAYGPPLDQKKKISQICPESDSSWVALWDKKSSTVRIPVPWQSLLRRYPYTHNPVHDRPWQWLTRVTK